MNKTKIYETIESLAGSIPDQKYRDLLEGLRVLKVRDDVESEEDDDFDRRADEEEDEGEEVPDHVIVQGPQPYVVCQRCGHYCPPNRDYREFLHEHKVRHDGYELSYGYTKPVHVCTYLKNALSEFNLETRGHDVYRDIDRMNYRILSHLLWHCRKEPDENPSYLSWISSGLRGAVRLACNAKRPRINNVKHIELDDVFKLTQHHNSVDFYHSLMCNEIFKPESDADLRYREIQSVGIAPLYSGYMDL